MDSITTQPQFPMFSKLPKELRLAIWEKALENNEARTLDLQTYEEVHVGAVVYPFREERRLYLRWRASDTRQGALHHEVDLKKEEVEVPYAKTMSEMPLLLVDTEARDEALQVYNPVKLCDLLGNLAPITYRWNNTMMYRFAMGRQYTDDEVYVRKAQDVFNLAQDSLCITANDPGKLGGKLGVIEDCPLVKRLCCIKEGGNRHSLYSIKRLQVRGKWHDLFEERSPLEELRIWESMFFQFMPYLEHLTITPMYNYGTDGTGFYDPAQRPIYDEMLAKVKGFFERRAARDAIACWNEPFKMPKITLTMRALPGTLDVSEWTVW